MRQLCIMNIFIALPLCRYYPGDEITHGCDGQCVWQVRVQGEIPVGFWWEIMKDEVHF